MSKNEFNLITLKDCLPRFDESWKKIARSFEWYYFDLANSDYDIVLLFAIKDPLTHSTKPSMWIEINDKSKGIKKQYVLICDKFNEEHSLDSNKNIVYLKLEFDANQIIFRADQDCKINEIKIILNNNLINGIADITPKSQGFMYNDGYYVFDKDNRKISGAVFTIPFYSATYNMAIEGDFKKVIHSDKETFGYTDHPFGVECLSLTHKDWFWGHFQNEKYCIQYSIVDVFNGFESKLNYVYINDLVNCSINIYENALYVVSPKNLTKTNWKKIKYPKSYKILVGDNLTILIHNLEPIFEIGVYNRSKAECSFHKNIGNGWIETVYEIGVLNRSEEENSFNKNKSNGWTEYVKIKEFMKKIYFYLNYKLHQKVIIK